MIESVLFLMMCLLFILQEMEKIENFNRTNQERKGSSRQGI